METIAKTDDGSEIETEPLDFSGSRINGNIDKNEKQNKGKIFRLLRKSN